ncbi:purple acid phosphatase family protein [Parapedobacter koreensis]|uniref:Calcineurin-like phosphoesterase n=1 Tax=Parapedobacter koreensis TaxID=332977 RepID=A0A1H7FQK3_9SPHI|nr:metallophosphoesterase family protein [Parapedobacter koreensis]SEK28258.1 Calcineurin-like phosphoesterase [Parapedobacter koreensis]
MPQDKRYRSHRVTMVAISVLLCIGCKPQANDRSIADTMDGIVTRLYAQLDADRLDTIGASFILNFITQEEREALATNYWQFKVNVPVVISLMRDTAQSQLPFWLEPSGFQKTALTVRNDSYTYEVWQKNFPAGEVKLGINGFDKHRPVYFVSVAPQDAAADLVLEPIFPVAQHIDTLGIGSFTYHDWDGLTLTDVPESLRGQLLLTTIRGRAREAHLIHAYRKTAFPAHDVADQLTLTLGEDPSSTMTVQWRTDTTIKNTWISYWLEGHADTAELYADVGRLEDRLLINDRYNQRFIARLTKLAPGSKYHYQVRGERGPLSSVYTFTTEPVSSGFSFNWFGDIHNDSIAGLVIQQAFERDSAASFSLCSGDLVNTGLHRDDWDRFFHYPGDVFARQPLMAVPGNHDSQDGLGASMFHSLLDYPPNGPVDFAPSGLSYFFRYQNALFVMVDAASFSLEEQATWLVETLASSQADWKFVVVHFPPFNEVEPYPEMVSRWVPLLEEQGVDLVLSGHFHYYLRAHPLKAGKKDKAGITYLQSATVRGGEVREDSQPQPFVAKRVVSGNFYQHFRIDGKQLEYTCYDADHSERDRLVVKK